MIGREPSKGTWRIVSWKSWRTEARHGEALAVADLERGLRTPRLKARDREVVDHNRRSRIDGADFRRDNHVDDAVGRNRRSEERLTPNGFHSTVIAELPLFHHLHHRHRRSARPAQETLRPRGSSPSRPTERPASVRQSRDRSLAFERVELNVKIRAERAESARDDPEAVGDRATQDLRTDHFAGTSGQ